MRGYKCYMCGGFCDPGELTSGVCQECQDEELQKQARTESVDKMLNAPFKQMELRLDGVRSGTD